MLLYLIMAQIIQLLTTAPLSIVMAALEGFHVPSLLAMSEFFGFQAALGNYEHVESSPEN